MELVADNLSVALGGRTIVRGVGFGAAGGQLVGLVGPNGAGKTTLLRAMVGLLPPAEGRVLLDGQPLASFGAAERARQIAYLPQDGASLWPVSVADLVLLGRLPHGGTLGRASAEDLSIVADILDELDLAALRDRRCTNLSGGERARALLARALATEPSVLVADEPVANLDPYHALEVMERLRARVAAGMAAVITLHDLTLAVRFCDTVVLLAPDGDSAIVGPPNEVLTAERLRSVYRIEAMFGEQDGSRWVLPWRRARAEDVRDAGEVGRHDDG